MQQWEEVLWRAAAWKEIQVRASHGLICSWFLFWQQRRVFKDPSGCCTELTGRRKEPRGCTLAERRDPVSEHGNSRGLHLRLLGRPDRWTEHRVEGTRGPAAYTADTQNHSMSVLQAECRVNPKNETGTKHVSVHTYKVEVVCELYWQPTAQRGGLCVGMVAGTSGPAEGFQTGM